MNRRYRAVIVMLLSGVFLIGLIQIAPAGKASAKKLKRLRGTIARISSGNNFIGVERAADGARVRVYVNDSSNIDLEHEDSGIEHLGVDDHVDIHYKVINGKRVSSSVSATAEHDFEGVITSIDIVAGTLSLQLEESSNTVDLTTDADTVYEIDDAHVSLSAFAIGDRAEAHYREESDAFVVTKLEKDD